MEAPIRTTEEHTCKGCQKIFTAPVFNYGGDKPWRLCASYCRECTQEGNIEDSNSVGSRRIREGLRVIKLRHDISRCYDRVLLRIVKVFRLSR